MSKPFVFNAFKKLLFDAGSDKTKDLYNSIYFDAWICPKGKNFAGIHAVIPEARREPFNGIPMGLMPRGDFHKSVIRESGVVAVMNGDQHSCDPPFNLHFRDR